MKQRGFTLLELMVAMAIFAMLAVAGWQVFDSVNRARERAQYHADNLAVLQYAYLQLQQDMGQIIAYQASATQTANTNDTSGDGDTANDNTVVATAVPLMSLDSDYISFVRFADPDPRYQSSPSVQRIEYIFADQQLIRRQYMSVSGNREGVSLDSVLLEDVTEARWQAYLPEISAKFPNQQNSGNQSTDQVKTKLLPNGVSVSFTYQDMPITWQWALTPQPAPNNSNNSESSSANNTDDNNSNNSNNDSENNNSTGNGTVSESTSTVQ